MNVFDASVTIHLVDKVSGGLATLSKSFMRTNASAKLLQNKMNDIHGAWHKGLIMGGAGMALAAPLIMATKEAEKYAHQLNQMKSAGLSNKEMADSTAAAWKTTGSVITSTALENLKVIMDLRSVFGDTKEGIDYMPRFAKIQGAYSSVLDGKMAAHADELTFSMAKSLDMIGRVKNAAQFNDASEKMFRVTEATGGRVTPADYQAVFKYARQAKYGMNDDFMFKVMPELILENKTGGKGGASGVGTQMQALYRFGVQGIMTVRAAENLAKMGLIEMHQVLKTTTTGTTLGNRKKGEMSHGGIFGAEKLAKNPFQWVQEDYLPKLAAANHLKLTETDKLVQASNQVFKGNALATSLVGELIKKQQQYSRFPGMFDKTDTIDQAYNRGLKNDPEANWKALHASFENLKIAVGINILPVIIPAINKLAVSIGEWARYLKDNPGMTKMIVGAIALTSGLLILAGAISIIHAAFMSMMLVVGPIAGGVMAVVRLISLIASFRMLAIPLLVVMGGACSAFTLIGLAVTAVVLVIMNWKTIMLTVKGMINNITNAFWNMVPAMATLVAQIGAFAGAIPGLAGLGQSMGLVAKGMNMAYSAHQLAEKNKTTVLAGKVNAPSMMENLKQALASKAAAHGGQVVQHINVSQAQVPGHDHDKCVATMGKALARKVGQVTAAKAGTSSVSRSSIAFGAGG